MKRLAVLIIVALAFPLAFAPPTLAQEGKTFATVTNGTKTIEFKAAGTSDLDMAKLKAWSDFATNHPDVARELAHKPALITDEAYAKNHPELRDFFSAHPDIRDEMAENPGNYVAIPPRPGE